jgi:hypothetical protein
MDHQGDRTSVRSPFFVVPWYNGPIPIIAFGGPEMSVFAKLAALPMIVAACDPGPVNAVKGFYRSVAADKFLTSAEYLPKDLRDRGDTYLEPKLAFQRDEITRCGGIKSMDIKLVKPEGQDSLRTGSVVLSFKGVCDPREDQMTVVRDDRGWRLQLAWW